MFWLPNEMKSHYICGKWLKVTISAWGQAKKDEKDVGKKTVASGPWCEQQSLVSSAKIMDWTGEVRQSGRSLINNKTVKDHHATT